MDPLGEHSDSDGKYLLPVIKQEPDYDEDNEISIIRSVEIYLRDSSYFRSEPKGENTLSNTNKEYEPCTDPLSFGTDVETKQDCIKDSTNVGPCASSKSDIFTKTDVDPYNSQAVIKKEPNWEYEEIHIEDDYSKIFSVCHKNRSKLESLLTKDIEEHFENLRSIEPQPTQFEMEPETQNNQRELSMESSTGQMVEGTYLEPQNQETPIEEGDSWIERPVKCIYHVSDSVEDDTVLNKPKCNDFYNNQSDETTGFVEDEDVNEQNSLEEIQSSKEKGNDKKKGIFVNEVKRDDRGNIVRSKGHCCMFCYRVMTKLHKHFINIHSTEIEVAKLLAMPKKSLVRRNGFIDLGRIGDYHHNIEVLSKKSGELILVRRPNRGEDVSYSEFSPCPYCLGFLIKKHLWHHIRYSCNIKRQKLFNKPLVIERRRVQVESRVLLMSSLIQDHNQPAIFNEKILKPMKDDKVTETCKNDPLILKLGNLQFEKYGLTKHELIRQEMRQLGRLLLTLRKLSGGGDKTLKDWFEPFEIDNLVAAVKQMCIKIDSENQTLQPQYKIPSLALKLGFSLRRCITIERGEALRNCNKSKSESLKDFLNLMEIKWSVQCFSNSIVESQESTKEVGANSELNHNAGKFDVTMKELSKDDDPYNVQKKEHQKTKRPLRKPIPKRSWTTEEKDAVMTFFHLAIQKRVVPGKKECEQCIRQNSALDRRSWRDIKYYIHNYYKKIKKMTTYLSCSNNKKKRSLKRQFPVTIEESSKEDFDDSHHPQKKDQKKTKRPKPNGPLKENILHYHKTNFYFGKRFEPCTDPLSFGTIEANQDYVIGGSTNFGPCASFKSDIFINTDVDSYNSEVLPKKEPNMEYEEIQIEDDHSKIFSVGPKSRSKPES
ncbi:uncharacterized protein LOC128993019 [Macrosteles quadrilineatus]|uniref:uncharacterized protein LOC128993019 n=1 Tax=Macrosteles quadrilineatus TaxID=74068 RepID=UPI0023E0909A|nr:uncharacterized protein LOC128993019 [Macrosteles quadrilineatus]